MSTIETIIKTEISPIYSTTSPTGISNGYIVIKTIKK